MMDPRDKKLAKLLVNYSCDIQKDEKILIDYEGAECKPLIKQIIRDVYEAGGKPFVNIRDSEVNREVLLHCDEEQVKFMNEYQLAQMKGMDAYIAVRAGDNASELADVPSEKLNLYSKLLRPVLDYRVNDTKWCILRYPNPSMAQLAGTSQEAFADFFYDVCTLDYEKMSKAMDPLKELLDKTDKVNIKGPGTDLEFSIKGIGAVKCDGKMNIPDGEVYTAPVKNSMNGYITYNTVSQEQVSPMRISVLKSRTAKLKRRRPMIRKESTSCWIPTKAPDTSVSLPSA